MGSDSALTALAVAGIALFAVAIVLIIVLSVTEARRGLRAFGDLLRAGPGRGSGRLDDEGVPRALPLLGRPTGRFEIRFQSKLDIIDEEHELRPFLRQLLAEGRRDEAVRLYQAFKRTDAPDAEAALDALARDGG